MLAYAAIHYQRQGLSNEQAHGKIYNELLPQLDSATQAFLTTEPFDRKAKASPEFFAEQLPFYTTKPLYNALVSALCIAGLTPLEAMRMISAIGYGLVALCVFAFFVRLFHPVLALLFSLLLPLMPVAMLTARLLTPDMLSSAFVLWAFALYLLHKRFHAPVFLLLLSIGLRVDNAVIALTAALLFAFADDAHRARRLYGIAYAILAVMIYLVIGQAFGSYGWKITFQHSILDLTINVSMWAATPLTFDIYIDALVKGIRRYQLVILPALFFTAASIAATNSLLEKRLFDNGLVAVAAVLFSSMCVKFLAFPRFDVRYYVPQYVFALLLIIIAVLPQRYKTTKP